MASAPTLGIPFKTNTNRYEDALKQVVHQEMCRVFLWLYKGGKQYVGDYLKTVPRGLKYLNKNQKALLERRERPTNMDIALLYRLLQLTCGLAERDNNIWDNPQPSDEQSLEHSLYLLKEERNKVSHETQNAEQTQMDDAEFDEKLETLRLLCCRILCEAARLCGRHCEISNYIDKMQAKFHKIRGITPQMFAQLATKERQTGREVQEGQGEIIQDLGYIPPLLVRQEGATVALAELLRCRCEDGSDPHVILVTGEAGAGKTSLSRYLEESWLKTKGRIQELQRYDLLLGIHCRDVYTSDVVRLLREVLLPDTTAWCDPYKQHQLLQELRMIWVLDGLEEATEKATSLISRMLKQQPASHTLLVTSRPEHGLALQHKYTDCKMIKVNLCGVDPMVVFQMLQSKNRTIYSKKRVDQFIADFKGLDEGVQRELRNPLKMQLALQDWENVCRDQEGLNLSRLYLRIKDAHIKSLVTKFTSGNVTERDASRKVNKWFHSLCKVAFDVTRAQKLNTFIDGTELKELEDKCDDLQISSSECLSTFLAHHTSVSPLRCPRYSFFHSTQQYFLAAFYGVSSLETSTDVSSDIYKMFGVSMVNGDSREPEIKSLVHFQEVLLHIIFLLGNSVTDECVEVLVKLLSHAIPRELGSFEWFKVVQKGSYDKRIIKEVSKVISQTWLISDSCVKAARHLLEYTQPTYVVIDLLKSPRYSPDLIPLLQEVANLQHLVWVELTLGHDIGKLNNYSTSDEYLRVLCHEDSSCVILGFKGHLSDEGYDLLRLKKVAMFCEVLGLKVKSTESIERMCDSLTESRSLRRFHLTLALRNPSCISARLPDNVDLYLYLPYINDETAADTATLISRLSCMYKIITVKNNISVHEVKNFVLQLLEENVEVQSFVRELSDEETGRHMFLSYGRLPLEYSVLDFQINWLRWKDHFSIR